MHQRRSVRLQAQEAVARIWPANAFWLITGITDAKHGHVACAVDTADSFYPERHFAPRRAALPYFELACDMFLSVYKDEKTPSAERERELEIRLLQCEMARDEEEAALAKADEGDLADRLELAYRRLARVKETAPRPNDGLEPHSDHDAAPPKKSRAKVKK